MTFEDLLASTTVLPQPSGWIALERHLISAHGLDMTAVYDADTDTLRQQHMLAHAAGQYTSGRVHRHA